MERIQLFINRKVCEHGKDHWTTHQLMTDHLESTPLIDCVIENQKLFTRDHAILYECNGVHSVHVRRVPGEVFRLHRGTIGTEYEIAKSVELFNAQKELELDGSS